LPAALAPAGATNAPETAIANDATIDRETRIARPGSAPVRARLLWSWARIVVKAQQARRRFDLVYAVGVRMDYTTVGHVTVDVMADGTRRAGGSAFYAALQAARLGARTRIVTRGVRAEIEELLEPYLDELELDVIESEHTTTLQTWGEGPARGQRMLAWAGEIGAGVRLDTTVVHLAPVARETPVGWLGRAEFVAVTPQGLVRDWSGADGQVVPRPLDLALLPARCDAIVFSQSERECCAALLEPSSTRGPVIAVTAAANAVELHLPRGVVARVEVPSVEQMCDDIGAGDVFAAAFFVELAEGKTPPAAATVANAAAAVRIGSGGAAAIGDRRRVQERAATVA
jgi:sugar/nucleoside kinase (ribokinase family)